MRQETSGSEAIGRGQLEVRQEISGSEAIGRGKLKVRPSCKVIHLAVEGYRLGFKDSLRGLQLIYAKSIIQTSQTSDMVVMKLMH